MKVKRYFRRTTHDIVVTNSLTVHTYGEPDIYKEGKELDYSSLTTNKTVSWNKMLISNNSFRAMERDNKPILIVYADTNKRRVLKKVGTDNQDRPVLKFNDIWIRISKELFKELNLNHLHSLNKEYRDLLSNLDVDSYRVVFAKTRFGYPDITLYPKEDREHE